jgi:micrococcal nuclease
MIRKKDWLAAGAGVFTAWALLAAFGCHRHTDLLPTAHAPNEVMRPPTPRPAGEKVELTVVRTVDGDTILVTDGTQKEYVRLLGINTPETHKPHWPVERCGPEAEAYTRAALPVGAKVIVDVEGDRIDHYGRTLGYVFSGGRDVNRELIDKGYAFAAKYKQPRRAELQAAEAVAHRNHVGCLWTP